MLRRPGPRRRPFFRAVICAALCGALLAGCGAPPELRTRPDPERPTPITPATAPSTELPADLILPTEPAASGSPTPTFAEYPAVPCAGHPSADQVIAVLRRKPGLSINRAAMTVRSGPLCAGEWQYTYFSVAGQEPLSVVTKGSPDSLTVVTAGTGVCSIPVRTGAPAGIRAAAGC